MLVALSQADLRHARRALAIIGRDEELSFGRVAGSKLYWRRSRCAVVGRSGYRQVAHHDGPEEKLHAEPHIELRYSAPHHQDSLFP